MHILYINIERNTRGYEYDSLTSKVVIIFFDVTFFNSLLSYLDSFFFLCITKYMPLIIMTVYPIIE